MQFLEYITIYLIFHFTLPFALYNRHLGEKFTEQMDQIQTSRGLRILCSAIFRVCINHAVNQLLLHFMNKQ